MWEFHSSGVPQLIQMEWASAKMWSNDPHLCGCYDCRKQFHVRLKKNPNCGPCQKET